MNDHLADAVLDMVLGAQTDEQALSALDDFEAMTADTPAPLSPPTTPQPTLEAVERFARRLERTSRRLERALRYAWVNKGNAGTSRRGLPLYKWEWDRSDGQAQRPRIQHTEPGTGRTPAAAQQQTPKAKPAAKKPQKPTIEAVEQELTALDRENISEEHVARITGGMLSLTKAQMHELREKLGLAQRGTKSLAKTPLAQRILEHVRGKGREQTQPQPTGKPATARTPKGPDTHTLQRIDQAIEAAVQGEGNPEYLAALLGRLSIGDLRTVRDKVKAATARTKEGLRKGIQEQVAAMAGGGGKEKEFEQLMQGSGQAAQQTPKPAKPAPKAPEKPTPPPVPQKPAPPPVPQKSPNGYEFSERVRSTHQALAALHAETETYQSKIADNEKRQAGLYEKARKKEITNAVFFKQLGPLIEENKAHRDKLQKSADEARRRLVEGIGGNSNLSANGSGSLDTGPKSPAGQGVSFVSSLLHGGMKANIDFVLNGDRMENRPYYDPLKNHISLRKSSSASTAAHEMGHWIEHNVPGASEAAREFLRKRVKDEPLTKLKDKFGESYMDWETGRKDNFDQVFGDGVMAYYVGSGHPTGDTEIISMGLEQMYRDPVKFAAKDPEYFQFVVSVLDGSGRKGNLLPRGISLDIED